MRETYSQFSSGSHVMSLFFSYPFHLTWRNSCCITAARPIICQKWYAITAKSCPNVETYLALVFVVFDSLHDKLLSVLISLFIFPYLVFKIVIVHRHDLPRALRGDHVSIGIGIAQHLWRHDRIGTVGETRDEFSITTGSEKPFRGG